MMWRRGGTFLFNVQLRLRDEDGSTSARTGPPAQVSFQSSTHGFDFCLVRTDRYCFAEESLAQRNAEALPHINLNAVLARCTQKLGSKLTIQADLSHR